jgi:hypothetical protein
MDDLLNLFDDAYYAEQELDLEVSDHGEEIQRGTSPIIEDEDDDDDHAYPRSYSPEENCTEEV